MFKIKIKNYLIYSYLLLFIVLLRFQHSFLGLSISEHDWTFLSLGKSFIDGNLPYTRAYDLRGPLTYIIYSVPLLFQDYIFFLKLFGIISLWIASIACFLTSKNLFGNKSAIFSAFSFALVSSSEKTFLMTEVEIFMLPLIAIFILFILSNVENPKKVNLAVAALAICFASLIKSYLVLIGILGCSIVLMSQKNKIFNLLIYIIAGLIPIFLLLLTYAKIPYGLELLWNSMYSTTAAYTGNRSLLLGYFQFFEQMPLKPWFPIFLTSLIAVFLNKKVFKEKVFMFLSIIIIIISFLLSRKYTDYHILTTLPLVSIMASSFFDNNNNFSKRIQIAFVFICCLGPLIKNFSEQIKINYQPINKTIILSKYLKNIIKKKDSIFSLDNGLYLLLDKEYPTKIYHPSNIFRYPVLRAYYNDRNFTTENELKNILNKKPDYIIMLDIWKDKLGAETVNYIYNYYTQIDFITDEELLNLKKVNREYLKSITLYKRLKLNEN